MNQRDITYQPCHRFSIQEILRYLQGTLSDSEAEAFESHAHQCPACLRKITQAENEYLLQTAMARMDQLDTGVVTVIIKAAKDLFEFVSATAEAVFLNLQPVPIGARGHAEPGDAAPLVIQKQFAEHAVSAELTLTPLPDHRLSASLSLYAVDNDRFLSDIAVIFRSDLQEVVETSDANGIAAAVLRYSEELAIQFSGPNQISGAFHVQFTDSE
jgi:hypothetical protein